MLPEFAQRFHIFRIANTPFYQPDMAAGSKGFKIGERRFIRGILGNFTRTAAFRMSTQTPEMEPRKLIGDGIVGWHYAAAPGTEPCLIQVIGDEKAWNSAVCDELTGILMSLTVLSGPFSLPLPMQLAQHELKSLKPFLNHYREGVASYL